MCLGDIFFGAEALYGAVLGFVGVVAKNWYQRNQAKRSEPQLSLELVTGLAPSKVNGRRCSFGRVQIANAGGRETAVAVAIQIERVTGSSSPEKVAYLPGFRLAWAKADSGRDYVEASTINLAGGATQQVDLVHLNETVTRMIVDVRPQPKNEMNYLSAGGYRFDLALSAENAGTRRFSVEVAFEEGWDGDYGSAPGFVELRNLRLLS